MSGPEAVGADLDIPYRFDRTHAVGEVLDAYAGLAAGAETGTVVSVSGRLMLRRHQGRLAFGALQDATGRVQLFATAKATPSFDRFTGLSIGDWIGVTGEVMATRRGELSVRVDDWVVLARARRPFPDKWHGLADPDIRYRQRHLDLWVSPQAREAFQRRSSIVSSLRRRLAERGFAEVETPMLHPIPGGAAARPFVTRHEALRTDLYLRIAPELYLKRLVIGGMERVFEIGRVFRNEGISTRHNPEFTILELYWAYADYTDIMELTEHLVADVAVEVCGSAVVAYDGREVDLTPPWRRATMDEAIAEHTGAEMSLDTPRTELAAFCDRLGVETRDGWGPGDLREDRRARPLGAGVRDRPSGRGVAAGPPAPEQARLHRALRGDRGRSGAVQRVLGADRPRRAAVPLRGPGRAAGCRRRRGHGRGRGLSAGARMRPAAHRRARHRRRPAGHAADRNHRHPRRGPVSHPPPRSGFLNDRSAPRADRLGFRGACQMLGRAVVVTSSSAAMRRAAVA